MVLYRYEINTILVEPLKNNINRELGMAQTIFIQSLLYQGLKTKVIRINNECPEALWNLSKKK